MRGDIFRAAHVMMVKKLVGSEHRQLLHCVNGDSRLAKLSASLFADDVISLRMHVADVRFRKELGNRKRKNLAQLGERALEEDLAAHAQLMEAARTTYCLEAQITRLVAARLLRMYGAKHRDVRGADLASDGFTWKYHRKEEPEKMIYLLTDRGDLSFGDLEILLTRASMAPVDKYFALARRRIKAFDRGSRPTSGETTWYVNAFYDPLMIEKVATILRIYYNDMLLGAAESGKPKAERQAPAMKIDGAKGKVYVRDVLSVN